MSDENKLMGVTGNKMKATDPRIGFTAADIAYLKFVNHPKNVTEIPTAQEVADRAVGHVDMELDSETEPEMTDDPVETEEQRLRCFLACLLDAIRKYFGKKADV